MSNAITSTHGSWTPFDERVENDACSADKIWLITFIALLAIGSMLVGGFMRYFNINEFVTGMGTYFILSGALLAVGDIIGIAVCGVHYTIHECSSKSSDAEADKKQNTPAPSEPTHDLVPYHFGSWYLGDGVPFRSFGTPNIFCLQGADEHVQVPDDYSSFGQRCRVVWNTAKFSKISHALLTDTQDTIVLLKDHDKGITICVGSVYTLSVTQATYELATMEQVQADFYVLAGYSSVPSLQQHGYRATNTDEMPPSLSNAIFVKARTGKEVYISNHLVTGVNPLNPPRAAAISLVR